MDIITEALKELNKEYLDEAYWGLYKVNNEISDEDLLKVIKEFIPWSILKYDQRIMSDKKHDKICDALNIPVEKYIYNIEVDEDSISISNNKIHFTCKLDIGTNWDNNEELEKEVVISKDVLLDLIDRQFDNKVDMYRPERAIKRALCKVIINGLWVNEPTNRLGFFESLNENYFDLDFNSYTFTPGEEVILELNNKKYPATVIEQFTGIVGLKSKFYVVQFINDKGEEEKVTAPEWCLKISDAPTQESLNEDLIIIEAEKSKDKLFALKDEIEKAQGNLKALLCDLFDIYMFQVFFGGVPNSSEERDELKSKGISTDELIHADLTREEWNNLQEWRKTIKTEFKK